MYIFSDAISEYFSFLRLIDYKMLAVAQDRQPLDVKFEATTPMPPTRMADADAVAAVAAALAKDDEPAG